MAKVTVLGPLKITLIWYPNLNSKTTFVVQTFPNSYKAVLGEMQGRKCENGDKKAVNAFSYLRAYIL